MAIRAVNLTKTVPWTWDEDPGKGTDDATVFEFRPLKAHEQAWLNDRMMTLEGGMPVGKNEAEVMEKIQGSGMRNEVFKTALEAVRIATVNITNLQDEDGNVLPFATKKSAIAGRITDVVTDELLDPLPIRMVMAAYRAIMQLNVVTPDQAKNSD